MEEQLGAGPAEGGARKRVRHKVVRARAGARHILLKLLPPRRANVPGSVAAQQFVNMMTSTTINQRHRQSPTRTSCRHGSTQPT